jgi:hypothetical protein
MSGIRATVALQWSSVDVWSSEMQLSATSALARAFALTWDRVGLGSLVPTKKA